MRGEGMDGWIASLAELQRRGEPGVLVTLVEAQGSTPRAAGTKMLVGASQAWHSIGGGHLELRALEIARGLLASGAREPLLERFSLGASLGQCCGGAVLLLFEPLLPARVPVAVFGAGHVGRALVPLLAGLPCRVRWIDARAAEFPAQIPVGVETVVSDEVVDEVDELPPGSYCIVMTHDHQLDLQLAERILRRGDGKQAVLYEVIARETREERVADRRRTPPDIGRKAERIEATLALFDPKRPAGSEPSR